MSDIILHISCFFAVTTSKTGLQVNVRKTGSHCKMPLGTTYLADDCQSGIKQSGVAGDETHTKQRNVLR